MQIPITDGRGNSHRSPWSKGKLIGSKPPLRTKNVWSIRTKLQVERRIRDLAMFNLAIDSKLRGCDVVSITDEDVAPNGVAIDWATVRQKKTGHRCSVSRHRGGRRSGHRRAGGCLNYLGRDGVIGRPSLWIAEDIWVLRFRLMVKRGPLL
jgi:hypothetical protein